MPSVPPRTTLLILLLVHGGPAFSQIPLDDSDQAKVARRAHLMEKAAEYQIRLQSETGPELTLIEPVLRFNDNVTGVVDGLLLLWTHRGRPEASSSFGIRENGSEYHEFQSLACQRLFAQRNGIPTWYPVQAGITPKPVPQAPPPAATARLRLSQMKALARQFRAAVTDRTGRQQLRLLPQPVYRFPASGGRPLDGALFLFCKGTNPEVMLLLEARAAPSGFRWHYSTARMTSRAIEVRRHQDVVWSVPYLRGQPTRLDPTQPYCTVVATPAAR